MESHRLLNKRPVAFLITEYPAKCVSTYFAGLFHRMQETCQRQIFRSFQKQRDEREVD